MSKIVSKLNLNKTPQLVENNSLIMAKNIRLLEDGSIGPDTSMDNIKTSNGVKYISQIVGLDNKIYFFIENDYIVYSHQAEDLIINAYPGEVFVGSVIKEGEQATFDVNSDGFVTRDGELFEDSNIASQIDPTYINRVKIFVYDEIYKTFDILNCGWKYSGGKINGCVFKNNTGNTILTICEYDVPNKLIPIKHININECSSGDNESIYTQNPNIGITNLLYAGDYSTTIPAGVYQFFIRYKINDNHYTNWFPCSKDYYTGSKKKVATIQGELYYVDRHIDSDTSFIFNVEHLYPECNNIYEKYQIGFILSKDDGSIIAREWKEFGFDISTIYFDCFTTDIKEVNIDDLLETSYEIFNVENCALYKNKLYIANYEETNFNPDLENLAKEVEIEIKSQVIESSSNVLYFDDNLLISSQNNTHYDYIKTQSDNNHIKTKWGKEPYFKITNVDQNEDITEYFDEIPFIDEEHHHVENSNVRPGDYTYSHYQGDYPVKPASVDDDELDSNYVPLNGWMNSVHIKDFRYNQLCALRVFFKNGNDIVDLYPYNYTATYNIPYQTDYIINGTIEKIVSEIDKYIREKIAYFDTSNNKWYILLNNNYYPISDYYITYSQVKETHREHVGVNCMGVHAGSEFVYDPEFDVVFTQKTTKIVKRNFVFYTSNITSEIKGGKIYPTLLPFTNYNFYIHYVKANGVHTNGYLINSEPVYLEKYSKLISSSHTTNNVKYHDYDLNPITLQENDNIILYPSFNNIKKPEGYVGCFITASKVSNNVCQLFNIQTDATDPQNVKYIGDCLELDTLLYTKFDDITIYNSNGNIISENGKYYSSGTTEDIKYFGQCGNVVWTTNELYTTDNKNDDIFWIVIRTNNSTEKLIKFTPYIKLSNTPQSYDDYDDINYLGFVSYVKKLLKNSIYVSGNDVYSKSQGSSGNNNESVILTEIVDENEYMLIRNNKENRIKSNFNLNYLNLTEDIAIQPKTIVDNNVTTTLLLSSVNSLISSNIYTLNSWYKDYTKKVYSVYTDKHKIRFDNTIRCSNIIQDESYDTFKFNSTDYYNVPTSRGIITNLISIVNFIYVHCEHSLFKFSDNKAITSENEEVVLQENDIFNSGIKEVFDSQHGQCGLKKRTQSLVTFNAYIFYDEVVKKIYAFGGEQQLSVISDSIKKLIDDINPSDVLFNADENNYRFFVNFVTNNGNVCLSFNFNAKDFVSVHDINFKVGFNSRRYSYFVHENKNINNGVIGFSIYKLIDVIKVETSSQGINSYNYTSYKNCYEKSIINIADCDTITTNSINSVNSCVDIIINTQYEKIKSLDYLSWICSKHDTYNLDANFISEENIYSVFPGNKLRIYSDSTYTDLYDLLEDNDINPKIANNYRNIDSNGDINANPKSWQYPQYNCGVWSMNYFRNIKLNDLFDYTNPINKITGDIDHSETTDLTPNPLRENLTQENTLIYGKYFVIRFIFNNVNFKLENVILRMNDYDKTK